MFVKCINICVDFQSLLSLLMTPAEDTREVSQHAIQTLRDLTTALETRIYYYQDPSLYTPKQGWPCIHVYHTFKAYHL